MSRSRTVRAPRRRAASPQRTLLVALLALCAGGAVFAQGRCVSDEPPDVEPAALAAPASARAQLLALAQASVARSQTVGAARLLAEAAEAEAEEVQAGLRTQASLDARVGPGWSRASPGDSQTTADGQLSLTVRRLIDDGGRTARLVESRRLLAEAARSGAAGAQEQVVLATVQQALELGRLRLQQRIYEQYARKMSCLVDALQTVVAADRGRASELVQARKSAAQVELSRAQVESQVRQSEVRLRRLVGDAPIDALGPDALAAAVPALPDLPALLADAEGSLEVRQSGAQAAALARVADAADAARKPQLSWVLGAGRASSFGADAGTRHASSLGLSLSVSLPVLAPAVDAAALAARRRADAAAAQRDELVEGLRARVRETHEQVLSARDRARRVQGLLESSNQVRNATLQQWQQLGRRSLFDVIAAESDHYALRLAHVDSLFESQQLAAGLLSLGRGIEPALR